MNDGCMHCGIVVIICSLLLVSLKSANGLKHSANLVVDKLPLSVNLTVVCPPDGEWPRLPANQTFTIDCPLPFPTLDEFLSRLPSSVGDPPRAFLDAFNNAMHLYSKKSRKCGSDGEWEDVVGACSRPFSACWQNTYGRGVGEPLSRCLEGTEQNGLLCYPRCRSGYYGVGPVCWESCPAGYHDDGALCRKGGDVITSENHCPWYDACGIALAKGCTKCPAGYKNAGCFCTEIPDVKSKTTYGRGVGHALSCASGMEQSGLLCYDKCGDNYYGVGPVCWKNGCPAHHPFDCGALCTSDAFTCGLLFGEIVVDAVEDAVAIVFPEEVVTWVQRLYDNPVFPFLPVLLNLILTPTC